MQRNRGRTVQRPSEALLSAVQSALPPPPGLPPRDIFPGVEAYAPSTVRSALGILTASGRCGATGEPGKRLYFQKPAADA
jgi:hypothetical protein